MRTIDKQERMNTGLEVKIKRNITKPFQHSHHNAKV